MRHRPGTSLALALAFVAVLAAQAAADTRLRRPAARPRPAPESVVFSGTCTGAFAGEITVDGRSYRLAQDVHLYEVGRGTLPAESSLFDRVVTVTAIKVRNTLIVKSVVVRPAAVPGMTGGVGVRDANQSPR
jgi:hypothetical protein